MTDFIWLLLIGLAAGWLAGQIIKGGGYGLIGDLVVGIVGSFVGGFLFKLLGLTTTGLVGELVCALIGAIVLILILRAIKRR